jgi:uncharacterized repeat protein (TIGR02059 family)
MASMIVRRTWFGWPAAAHAGAPALGGSNKVVGANVTLNFDEPLRPAPVVTQFTATVAGAARVVNTATVAGSKLTLVLATPATAGQRVVITYVKNGTPAQNLADVAGNAVPNFVSTIYA